MSTFEEAIETARENIPVQQMVVDPKFWSDYTIIRRSNGEHHVYKSNAWDRPAERGLLPWQPPPEGEIVATVALDGSVEMAR